MEIKTGGQKPSAKNAKIKLKATDGHPYRKEGDVFDVHQTIRRNSLQMSGLLKKMQNLPKQKIPLSLQRQGMQQRKPQLRANNKHF